MSGDFKSIKLPAVKVAGLDEVKNISVTVPAIHWLSPQR